MRPESAGHRRAPLIEPRSSRLPTVRQPSGPAALPQPPWPTAARSHWATSKRSIWENPKMEEEGEGCEWRRGGCLDGGIPYLLLRGCCSVVRDCLELPPVPGIFKGNTKACDGPDLLELPFFYVSLHFLLCYTPSSLFLLLLSFLPFCFSYTLRLWHPSSVSSLQRYLEGCWKHFNYTVFISLLFV